jgi:hypothetical protein
LESDCPIFRVELVDPRCDLAGENLTVASRAERLKHDWLDISETIFRKRDNPWLTIGRTGDIGLQDRFNPVRRSIGRITKTMAGAPYAYAISRQGFRDFRRLNPASCDGLNLTLIQACTKSPLEIMFVLGEQLAPSSKLRFLSCRNVDNQSNRDDG